MMRKAPCPLTRVAGKEPADEQAGRLLERDEPRSRAPSLAGQPDEAVDLAGHADERVHATCRRSTRASCSAMVKPRLGMNGNGCAGSIASGVSTGKIVPQEMILQPASSPSSQIRAIDQHDGVILAQQLAQLAPARLLVARENADRIADAGELLGRSQPVRAL